MVGQLDKGALMYATKDYNQMLNAEGCNEGMIQIQNKFVLGKKTDTIISPDYCDCLLQPVYACKCFLVWKTMEKTTDLLYLPNSCKIQVL